MFPGSATSANFPAGITLVANELLRDWHLKFKVTRMGNLGGALYFLLHFG